MAMDATSVTSSSGDKMKKIMNSEIGFTSMENWNPTYKHHHLPLWYKKIIREVALGKGIWKKGQSHEQHFLDDVSFCGLWDHWGTVQDGDERSLITQPYAELGKMAEKFAMEHGCILKSMFPGPWHPSTQLYIFSPRRFL